MKKPFLLFLLPLTLVCLPSNKAVIAETEEEVMDENFIGADFSNGFFSYVLKDKFYESPNTIEAWVRMGPLGKGEPGGVIFGNYEYYNLNPIRLEITNERKIAFQWNKNQIKLTFDSFTLPIEKWTHISVVRDQGQGKLNLYINGALKEQKNVNSTNSVSDFRFIVGGDWTNWHEYKKPFKGEIGSVAAYSLVRSASEIKKDYQRKDEISAETRSGLLFSADFSFKCKEGIDKSSHRNNAILRSNDYFYKDSLYAPKDYSMFVIPDPQIMTHWRQENLDTINRYIIRKKDLYNVQMTMCVGDNADGSLQWDFELPAIREVFAKLQESGMRWATTAGNHDYDDNCSRTRGLTNYNRYFKAEDISKLDYFGGFFKEDESQDAYYTFETEGVKYLVLALEFGTTNAVLEWADSILGQERFADHRVIMFTHAYVGGDGERLAGNKPHRATSYGFSLFEDVVDADDIYNKLIKKHKNVFMCFSGHVPFDDIVVRRDVGDHGNIITSMLIDSQGMLANGCASLLSLLTFDELNQMVYVNYADSTREGLLFNIQNQFLYSFEGHTDILSSKYYNKDGTLKEGFVREDSHE